MKNTSSPIKFTTIFIPDPASTGYTAYVAEFPGAVSQGQSLEDAGVNLFKILPEFLILQEQANEEGRK